MIPALFLLAAPPKQPQHQPPPAPGVAVTFQPVGAGAAARMPFASPRLLPLTTLNPGGVTVLPNGLVAPRFASLEMGPRESPQEFAIAVDTHATTPRIFVDEDGDGDMTNDGEDHFHPEQYRGGGGVTYTLWRAAADLRVRYGGANIVRRVFITRYDPADPARAAQRDTLTVTPDYASTGQLTLNGITYEAALFDPGTTGDFRPGAGRPRLLCIDVNGNGRFDARGEVFDASAPFNIHGTTWELRSIDAAGESFEVARAARSVPEIPAPPDVRVGHPAPPFTAQDLRGAAVRYPQAARGHTSVLFFYASWCPDCKREIDEIVRTYRTMASRGITAIGVSVDHPDGLGPLKQFTAAHAIPWPTIFAPPSGADSPSVLYDVHSIPSAVVVDGSGTIRAWISGDHVAADLARFIDTMHAPTRTP